MILLAYNAFVIAVMAVLAYRLGRWWIILIAVLFLARSVRDE